MMFGKLGPYILAVILWVYVCHDLCLLSDGGHGIEDNEMKKIVKLVSKEIEAGDSDFLTYTEFEHMIATAPDFTRFFRIPIV